MKRGVDVVVSVTGLIVLSPLLIVLSALVRIMLGSPILFVQERPGRDRRVFRMYKFRTMTEERSADGTLLPDEVRLTGFGKLLRTTSADELPEFWNVLKGDMSLVGPRPLLVEYLDRYSPEQARRHEVRPGITGLAQVSGRNALSWDERLALDFWYVDHWSFWLDVKILFLTVWKVFWREGVSSPGHATMPEFMGDRDNERGV